MSLKLIALVAALAGFSLIACDKSTSSTADNTAALEAHIWLLTGATATPAVTVNGVKITDIFDSLFIVNDPCQRHQTTVFLSTNKVIDSYDSAATEPGCGTPDTGTWSLNGSIATIIHGTGVDADTTMATIVSVTASQLKVSVPVDSAQAGDGISHTENVTFTAK